MEHLLTSDVSSVLIKYLSITDIFNLKKAFSKLKVVQKNINHLFTSSINKRLNMVFNNDITELNIFLSETQSVIAGTFITDSILGVECNGYNVNIFVLDKYKKMVTDFCNIYDKENYYIDEMCGVDRYAGEYKISSYNPKSKIKEKHKLSLIEVEDWYVTCGYLYTINFLLIDSNKVKDFDGLKEEIFDYYNEINDFYFSMNKITYSIDYWDEYICFHDFDSFINQKSETNNDTNMVELFEKHLNYKSIGFSITNMPEDIDIDEFIDDYMSIHKYMKIITCVNRNYSVDCYEGVAIKEKSEYLKDYRCIRIQYDCSICKCWKYKGYDSKCIYFYIHNKYDLKCHNINCIFDYYKIDHIHNDERRTIVVKK